MDSKWNMQWIIGNLCYHSPLAMLPETNEAKPIVTKMIASLPYIWQWSVQGSLHCHSQWGWPPQPGRDCWRDSWRWNSTPESGMAIGRGKGSLERGAAYFCCPAHSCRERTVSRSSVSKFMSLVWMQPAYRQPMKGIYKIKAIRLIL